MLLRVREPDGQWRWNFLYNVSGAGMKVHLFNPCEPGDELDMELYVPNVEQALPLRACVVWREEGRPGFAGVRFIKLSPGLRQWLDQVVGSEICHTGYTSAAQGENLNPALAEDLL
jgi:hypothetical protein